MSLHECILEAFHAPVHVQEILSVLTGVRSAKHEERKQILIWKMMRRLRLHLKRTTRLTTAY